MVSGRPLRFLGTVVGGWIGLRIAVLWPAVSPPVLAVPHPALAQAARAATGRLIARTAALAPIIALHRDVRPTIVLAPVVPAVGAASKIAGRPSSAAAEPAAISVGGAKPRPSIDTAPIVAPGLAGYRLAASANAGSRWRASLWLIARDGGGGQAGFTGGTLGGGQTGARVGYLIDPARRLMLYGRLSSALAQPQAEAALGVDWQPTRLPVHLIAEERLPLQQGAGGPTLGVIAGAGPLTLPHKFRLEAYGQAGVVLRNGGVGFADGAVRLDRPVVKAGAVRLALGGGLWGAAQPGVARLDLGPALTADVPVKSHLVRLSLDWRERVAGRARPTSGPALTLGADF